MTRMLRFGAVGTIGFIVDAGVLVLAAEMLRISPLPARILSFLVAATVTYALNQQFTFRLAERFELSRWLVYVATTAAGAGINIGIYHLWVLAQGATPLQLVLGTAVGSLVAMFVNYFVSSALVFRLNKQLDMPIDVSK